SVKGVAPDARIMALRAVGGSSDALALALEFAADPDGNPETADHADIISMSVATAGTKPNQPVNVMLRNAVALGITAIVGAGNGGEQAGWFNSFAADGEVIAVAAGDLENQVLDSSSRGPAINGFTARNPDIV